MPDCEPIKFEDFGGHGRILHFAHPNAYPPACFRPLLEPLASGYRVVAMQQRPLWPGHEPGEFQDWQLAADDLQRFLAQQGYSQIIGVGHSLGAVATMKAARRHPELFSALVLIEPVFLEPQILKLASENPELAGDLPLVRQAQRRRTRWPDRQAAFEHFREKAVFGRWPDEALWSYVNGGLVETEEGDLTLLFSREWEAQIYSRFPLGVWEEIPAVTHPTLAIRGAESDTLSPKAWSLWQELQPQASFVEIAGAGHMAPMERPEELAEIIEGYVRQYQ